MIATDTDPRVTKMSLGFLESKVKISRSSNIKETRIEIESKTLSILDFLR